MEIKKIKKHPLDHIDNKKIVQKRPEGTFGIRLYHNKGEKRYLLKCGCCDENVEIYYSKDTLEINGVIGSIENWREVLLPLLNNYE